MGKPTGVASALKVGCEWRVVDERRLADAPLALLVVVLQHPPGVDLLRDPPLGDLGDEERLGISRPLAWPVVWPEELERELRRQDDLRAGRAA